MKQIIVLLLSTAMGVIMMSCKESATNPPEEKPPGYQEDIPWPSLGDQHSSMHQFDPQYSGRSKFPGPKLGVVEKIITIKTINSKHSYLTPISDNTSFFLLSYNDSTSPYSFLYKYNFAGELLWSYPLSCSRKFTSHPLIDIDGTIYFAGWDSTIYALKSDGALKWKIKFNNDIIFSTLNIDKNGMLYGYSSSGMFYAIGGDGNIFTSVKLGSYGSSNSYVSIAPDGESFFISGEELYCVTKTGALKWKWKPVGAENIFESPPPLIDAFGNIIVTAMGNSSSTSYIDGTYCLNSNGDLKYKIPSLSLIDKTIDKNGNLYLATFDSLISFNYDGFFRWGKKITIEPFSALICDSQNYLYITTSNGKLICLDDLGNNIWTINLEGHSFRSRLINNSERLVLLSMYGDSKNVHIIK